MNTAQLKNYAPTARRAFIQAVSSRAARLGITAKEIKPADLVGDVLMIGGEAFPRSIASPRRALVEKIKTKGFDVAMEALAYTWFNRFVAIRYMELHNYLDHGVRVLSHPENKGYPEILDHATDVDLPTLDKARAIELKLDGTKDEELYALLLKAQCNALHSAMPFLFEPVGGEDELVLPANLLHTDSLIRHLVESTDEALWENIEIIGWLYQFYISEKKDQVIGKVVKSEDIPAATQLFTPNWIVKYMVQNSLGAQWLATYPQSPLKVQMEYYIEPAEQTDEVNEQLAAITPAQLNPEELTLIDPASGSGHILVEAYELFKAIYLERGYRQRDVAQLILEKNLFGLDIDERAAQLTGFALMMKGRADDRRLFERGLKLNVMALVDSTDFDAEALAKGVELGNYGLQPGDLRSLKQLFEHATTFGSLIQVPEELDEKLPALKKLSEVTIPDLFVAEGLKRLGPLVQQAELLAAQYDAVVANPPYMGNKGMNSIVKKFAQDHFADAKSDLFACFIERGFALLNAIGYNAMVTMESWMFLSSYENFRFTVLQQHTLRNLAHFPYDGKRPTAMGINFGVAVISAMNIQLPKFVGHYCCSRYFELDDYGVPFEFPTPNERLNCVAADEFKKVPGSPVAYWISDKLRQVFEDGSFLGELVEARQGMATADNNQFLRRWFEVSETKNCYSARSREEAIESTAKWFPYNKGGEFRKWYGNHDFLVNWEDDGRDLFAFKPRSVIRSPEYYFQQSISWSDVTSGLPSFRLYKAGFIHDVTGMSAFKFVGVDRNFLIAFCNTPIVLAITRAINPTLHFQIGDFIKIPFLEDFARSHLPVVREKVKWLFNASSLDWDAYERSWDFKSLPILTSSPEPTPTLESSYTA
ncbi:BREX-1 system adenine-specific DNA-methyltransferase PglX, partial [Myxococcota bacterium]|nr:BREX-1 system adenine-specific DNA-methyltransferase PglX [Myxococcota bacterium]